MMFISNSKAFVQYTASPESFELKLFSYKICRLFTIWCLYWQIMFMATPSDTTTPPTTLVPAPCALDPEPCTMNPAP